MPLTEVVGFTEPYLGTDAFYINVNIPGITPKFVANFTESFVDTQPYYRSNTFPARTVVRTATGSGVGTQVTSVSGSNQLRLRTLTDYSFPYLTGGRYYLSTINRTATGFGTGSSVTTFTRVQGRTATGFGIGSEVAGASGSNQLKLGGLTDYSFPYLGGGRYFIGVPKRTATGSGVGSSTSIGSRKFFRTATGSGVGSEGANVSGSNQVRLGILTDYSFPYLTGGRYYLGAAVYKKQATGSGTGSGTATKRIGHRRAATGSGTAGESTSTDLEIVKRTATGSGTGSGDADPFLLLKRQATGDGTGTSSATFKRGLLRGATGSGNGTQTAVKLVINIRTATGFGVGTQNATKRIVWLRTASGSGIGSSTATAIESLPRTATGSGVGAVSQNAIWVKSRMFRVPQTTNFAFVEAYSEISWQPRKRLFARLPNGVRVENLFELQDGSYTINDPRDGTVVKVYLGSHVIPLTDEEVTDLTAAGYGAYIT